MDELKLPKDVIGKAERRWASWMEEKVRAWQSRRRDSLTTTQQGVPVVRRGKPPVEIEIRMS